VLARFPEDELEPPSSEPEAPDAPRIAIVGRPNVGKSTLANALLGEERMLVFDLPGTTRDSIPADFERGGKRYTLVDTAGMRRRARVDEVIEKFSVIKTLKAIDDCNVAILVLDGTDSVSDQDAHIAGYILEAGRALVVVVNKWDGLPSEARARVKEDLERRLGFLSFARTLFVSARRGTGLNALLPAVTILGLKSAEMLGGAILTETIFAWPGIGRYMFEAIRNRDFPVIQGTTLVFALIYVMTSLAVDFIHGALDPRVRRKML
jgi:GTP-binding protein